MMMIVILVRFNRSNCRSASLMQICTNHTWWTFGSCRTHWSRVSANSSLLTLKP